jgi:hypothetical protein
LIPIVIDRLGSSMVMRRQRAGVLDVGEGLADRDVGDAGDGDDLTGSDLVGVDALEGLGDVQLGDLDPLDGAVDAAPGDLVALAEPSVADAAQGEAADVRRGVEVRDERLEGMVGLVGRRRDLLEEDVHQRGQIVGEVVGVGARSAVAGDAVQDREVDLVLARIEVEEQLVDLVDDLLHPGVGPVDLVHDEDDRQVRLQRLAEDEAGLGQGALGGVDEQDDAVDHEQPALDLAAEVGVAGGVDDVDLHLAAVRRRPADRGVLREDRDALLALEVHRVHDALVHVLVLAEHPGLPEHGVDQRRLAVVDVGDDGDVAEVVADGHGAPSLGQPGGQLRAQGSAAACCRAPTSVAVALRSGRRARARSRTSILLPHDRRARAG